MARFNLPPQKLLAPVYIAPSELLNDEFGVFIATQKGLGLGFSHACDFVVALSPLLFSEARCQAHFGSSLRALGAVS